MTPGTGQYPYRIHHWSPSLNAVSLPLSIQRVTDPIETLIRLATCLVVNVARLTIFLSAKGVPGNVLQRLGATKPVKPEA